MYRYLFSLAHLLLVSVLSNAQVPNQAWVNQTAVNEDFSHAITSDESGNVYVVGGYSETSYFGNFILTTAGEEMYLAKYDATGDVEWVQSSDGNGCDDVTKIAMDTYNHLYFIGSFYTDTFILGTQILVKDVNSEDLFIACYDTSGNALWAQSPWCSQNFGNTFFEDIATDNNGNVYAIGSYSDSILFGSTLLTTGDTINIETPSMFVVKYNAAGSVIWAKSAIGSGKGNQIATDADGNVYIVGHFSDTVIIGSAMLTGIANNCNWYLAKFNADGNVVWAFKPVDAGCGYVDDMACDGIGNFYIAGTFADEFGIGMDSLIIADTTLHNNGIDDDIYFVKYDTSGTAIWAKSILGNAHDDAGSISIDNQNNLYITGQSESDSILFTPITFYNYGGSGDDVYILKVDPNGNQLWVKHIGGTDTDGDAMDFKAVDENNLYLVTDFESDSLYVDDTTLIKIGSSDIVVAKFGSIIQSVSDVDNQTSVNLFPNPTSGAFTIDLSTSTSRVQIIDVLGQVVFDRATHGASNYNCHLPENGLYFIRVTTDSSMLTQKLVVNQH